MSYVARDDRPADKAGRYAEVEAEILAIEAGGLDQLGVERQVADRGEASLPRLVAVAQSAPCLGEEPEIWFADTPDGVEFAKTLCGTCPIRSACLAGALDRHEPWGVWGGELFEQGRVIPRKRPRGRPRKETVAA